MAPIFSLIGDMNIRQHVNKNSCRANPSLKSAQTLSCGNMSIFTATLEKVRSESTACIVACLTNFLSDAEGSSTVSNRVDPVLQDVHAALVGACSANPDRSYLVSPPMYRTSPTWYREGLPEIMTLFSQALAERPPNLHLLPSFATPDFEGDGVNLTADLGLEFVLHLFDSSSELLASLDLPLPERAAKGGESTRVLEDRMMAIEQDHRHLSKVFESKTAVDAELADFHANERTQDFFVVSGPGLKRISDDLVGKAWQDQAVKDVSSVIKRLMGRSMKIVFVKNSTKRHEGAEVTYSVQMPTVADSKSIRDKFGSFFLSGRDERPTSLKQISIKNFVTPETMIRISILKLLGSKYRESNPGSKVKVMGYQPRPMIKIIPPASASDRRVMLFNYVEAVTKLPCKFSPSEIEPITRRVNPKLAGQIRSIFVVLSDDVYKKKRPQPPTQSKDAAAATEASDDNMSVTSEVSNVTSVSSASARTSRGSKREASTERSAPAKK